MSLNYVTLVSSEASKEGLIGAAREVSSFIGATSVSEQIWLREYYALDICFDKHVDAERFRELAAKIRSGKFDIFLTSEANRKKKMLLSDMDMTIVRCETLDEIAANSGIEGIAEQISAITTKAMNGEIDFAEALRYRVGLLEGLPVEVLHTTLERIEVMQGAETLVKTMRKHGAVTILVTGGFDFFSSKIAEKCGFEYDVANKLEVKDEKLTGKVLGDIVDKNTKKATLHEFCDKKDIRTEEVLSIGDGANDLPMLKAAGLGIGYYPKNTVANEVNNIILHTDLTSALYAQGYSYSEFCSC